MALSPRQVRGAPRPGPQADTRNRSVHRDEGERQHRKVPLRGNRPALTEGLARYGFRSVRSASSWALARLNVKLAPTDVKLNI